MQNIDLVFLLQPLIVIGLSVGTVVYWRWKEGFSKYVFGFSLLAYGSAIAAKVAFQNLTASDFLAITHGSIWFFGLYLGLQTMVFEVGAAYVVATFAVSRKKMNRREGVAYGLGLAFWENAVLIGASSLLSILIDFFVISRGGVAAETVHSLLYRSDPQLFSPPLEVLRAMGWGILERVSSLMVHLSWGYLCLRSAALHRRRYFLLALPMGLIDFLVPFVGVLTVPIFEVVIFMLAAFCVLTTAYVSRA